MLSVCLSALANPSPGFRSVRSQDARSEVKLCGVLSGVWWSRELARI